MTVITTIVLAVFANTAGCLRTRVDAESQTYAEMVVVMLSTMRDIYQVGVNFRSLLCADASMESAEDKAEYGEFCKRVFRMLENHAELVTHPRMADGLRWRRERLKV